MRLTEDIQPITRVKTRTAELLKRVNESRRPLVITQNGEARGVLLDVESYENLKNAALTLKLLAQGEADVRAGRTTPQREVFQRARSRLARR